MNETTYRRLQYLLGGAVTVGTFIVYALTVAPTLSYWDCGEFIACSYILGIPHPPGTPLFVLIGRLFSLLPISADIAVRVNYVSVVSTALAAGVAFFVMARLIRDAICDRTQKLETWQAVLTLGGAVSATLFMAFSSTHWNNAVEAEVYGASMFLIMVLCWLAVQWRSRLESGRNANKYLVAIGYLAMLSMGIHQTVFLAMPVIFLFIIMTDATLRRDWRFWMTGIVLFMIIINVQLFLITAGAWLILTWIMAANRRLLGRWMLIAGIMTAGWVGFSCHLFIPIRSDQDPNIDENNPETLDSFVSFLERKQYGQKSMITRMFDRRGTWANQFGDHAHMGFYRYFKEQYGVSPGMMLPVIIIGLLGAWWLTKRRMPSGFLIFVLFLAGSVGLVLYMNFADGTQYYRLKPDAYMEVRNRDYFFTPGFIMFGLMIGLGLTGIADTIARRLKPGKTIAMVIAVIAALLPLQTLRANWRGADRSRNYTPYDYAYNILNSCGQDAILFTGGDNDTFPLWCLQDVYHVRRDVSIVNLSLANTDWYIYQMKHQWGLPLSFTDDQILWTVPDERFGGEIKRPKEPFRDPMTGQKRYLSGGYADATPAMIIVEDILRNNKWRRPICFSGSPGGKSRYPLESRTKIVGGVFVVGREESNFDFEYEETAALMDTVFKLRSYNSPKIGLDDNAIGLAQIYPEKELAISDYYRREADTAKMDEWLNKAVSTFPFYWRAHEKLAESLRQRGDSAAADLALQTGIDTIRAYVREMPTNRMYWYFLGRLCQAVGRDAEAQEYLTYAFYLNPYDSTTYQSLLTFLVNKQKVGEAARAARKWLEYYPDDAQARRILELATTPPSQ
jgi:tetratricopeptide (TPR) repeat protein